MSREWAGAKNFVVPCTGDVDQEMVPVGPANPLPVAAGAAAGGAYTDRSIANPSGVSQALMAANPARKVLIVQNVGTLAMAVNLTGGAAAINTGGSITLQPGGTITLDTYPPTSAITAIGTAGSGITAMEG
jgi:hypothetical protein